MPMAQLTVSVLLRSCALLSFLLRLLCTGREEEENRRVQERTAAARHERQRSDHAQASLNALSGRAHESRKIYPFTVPPICFIRVSNLSTSSRGLLRARCVRSLALFVIRLVHTPSGRWSAAIDLSSRFGNQKNASGLSVE